jgi:hypothetical protein
MGEIRANIMLPTGVLIYQYNSDSSSSPSLSTPGILVNIKVVAFGLSGPPTSIHIHGFSAIGVSAGVLVPICGPPLTTSCSLTTSNTESSDAQFAFQRSFQVVAPAGAASSFGSAYVNVHTQKNAMGEVRGQMALIQSLPSIGNLLPITPPAPAPTPAPASASATPSSSSVSLPASNMTLVSSTAASTAAPNSTSPSPPTTSPPPPPAPLSTIPTLIAAGAAATSGHMPRALELVQFLSIYCTSLSSQQQSRVSDFQVASFTNIAISKQQYCRVCPGACLQPLVLLLPTFALMSCFFVFGLVVAAFDAYHAPGSVVSPVQDGLFETSASSRAAPAGGCSSLRRTITAFCVRYFRGLIETSSSYLVMPCTFVFVLNLRSSSFEQADSWQCTMIVMLPVMTVLLRALVVRQRVVQLTTADQKQLVTGSVCSCLIAAVLSAYFELVQDAHQLSQPLASETLPQYIVLGLLVVQVSAQTVIRLKATEESFFDNTDWPWSSARAQASSAVFTFDELTSHLVMGSLRSSASFTAAIVAVKFVLLNYLPLSQMAMVVAGLASSRATSPPSIETSSVIIGCIPLITSGALLLHNMLKIVTFLRKKWCGRRVQAGRRSDRDSFY